MIKSFFTSTSLIIFIIQKVLQGMGQMKILCSQIRATWWAVETVESANERFRAGRSLGFTEVVVVVVVVVVDET